VSKDPSGLPSGTAREIVRQPLDEQIDVFGVTDPGKVRRENQDHFLLCTLHRLIRVRSTSLPNPELLEMPSQRLAFLGAVADGVGGSEGGGEASRAAIEAIARYACHTMDCYYASNPGEHGSFLESLREAARRSHEQVLELARQRPDVGGMATTLTLALSVWPSLFLLQIGDSRAYLLRDGRLHRLTRDQTLAQELVDDGVLPEARLSKSPFAHVLSSAIGSNARPVVTRLESDIRDVVMLCTDGLTKHVSDERIRERLLAMTTAEQTGRALLQDALDGGGTDNVTIVLGRAMLPPG
jgi:protein phosphatase